jgi:glycerophosphoryl diester phosphodiesterase
MRLFAHRGASAVAPESTEAALLEAIDAGADGVELDVQLSRDGRLIVFHDERLDRTSNGTGTLTSRPWRVLATLDTGAWFAPRFAGQRMLLASQALRLLRRRCDVNLELKRTSRAEMLIDRLLRCLRWTRATRRVLVSSFDLPLLSRLLRRAPRIATAALCDRAFDPTLRTAVRLRCHAIHPHVSLVTEGVVHRAHAAGLRVHVWTVDQATVARRLSEWGVDGIFCNDPRRMARALGPRR